MAMIAMGSALGTGLFLGSGAAMSLAGPAVIVSFAVGSAIAMVIAFAMGEMASRYPVRGGFGTLASRFLSPFWGYLVRWLYWIVTVGVTAAELVACTQYIRYWVPELPLWLGIVGFAALVFTVNVASVGSFGVIEFFLSSLKVIAITVFIALGIVLVTVGLPSASPTGVGNWVADGGFAPHGVSGVWLALAFVMFSFGGIELLSISAAEAKNPARSIKTAARSTVIRLSFFYVAAIAVVLALVPWRVAAGSGEDVEHSPFVMAFGSAGIPGAAAVTNAVVLVAALSAANANVYAGSRSLHSLASEGFAPRLFAATTRRGVPLAAIIGSCVGIASAVVLAVSGVGGVFELLMAVVSFSLILVWVLILVTYLRYHRVRDGGELLRVPGGRVTAVAGLVGLALVFATVTVMPHMQVAALVGVPFVLAVSVAYALVVRYRVDSASIDASFAEAESARGVPARKVPVRDGSARGSSGGE